MPQYDGTIRVDTKIDAKNSTAQMMKIVDSIKKSENEISRLTSKMNELKNVKTPTEEYKKLEKELESASAEVEKIYQKMQKFKEIGFDVIPESAIADLDKASLLVGDLELKMDELVKSGRAFHLGSDSDEYIKMADRVDDLTRNIHTSEMRLSELHAKQKPVESTFEKICKTASGMGKIFGNAGRVAGKAFRHMKDGAKKLFSSITSGTKKSNGLLATFVSRLNGIALSLLVFNWISKGFNKMVEGMNAGFKNLMKYSDDYANSVQSLKNSMSTLGNQFAATFAPIVQMAIPYLIQLINWINTAMNAVAQLIATLSGKDTWTRATKVQAGYNDELDNTASSAKKAFGALAKFDDLDVLQKQDDSGSGSGAGGAATGGFEEVPVDNKWKNIADWLKEMWENSDFYELGELLGQKLKDALDNIPWDGIKESARKIGKSIATFINGFIEVDGLGYSIGNTLAQAFNTAFEFLYSFVRNFHWDSLGAFIADGLNGVFQNIDWGLIRNTFLLGARGIADAINSFVDELDWTQISTSISNALNTLSQTIITFFDTVDWSELGSKIGEQIMQTIEKINWGDAGAALSKMAQSLLDAINAALGELDWAKIGKSIGEFIGAIEWDTIMQSVGKAIADALTGAIVAAFAALTGEDLMKLWEENKASDKVTTSNPYKSGDQSSASWLELDIFNWDDTSELFKKAGEDIGENLMLGLLEGITAAFLGVYEPILDLFNLIIDGVKELLGIESPSTVFYDIGLNIILGLLNGLSETWNTIMEWFAGIKQWFVDGWEEIKEQVAEKVEMLKEKVTTTLENLKLNVQQKFNTIKEKADDLKNKFEDLKLKASSAFTTMKTNILNAIQPVIDRIQQFIDKVQAAIQAIKDFLNSGFEKISSFASGIGSKLSGVFSGGGVSVFASAPAAASYSMDNVPALASGSVIRGGNPFLALLGDQPTGQTNIEAPLSTIEQAVENVMSRNGYGMGGVARIVLQLNGQDVGEALVDDLLSVMSRRGLDVEVLGVT